MIFIITSISLLVALIIVIIINSVNQKSFSSEVKGKLLAYSQLLQEMTSPTLQTQMNYQAIQTWNNKCITWINQNPWYVCGTSENQEDLTANLNQGKNLFTQWIKMWEPTQEQFEKWILPYINKSGVYKQEWVSGEPAKTVQEYTNNMLNFDEQAIYLKENKQCSVGTHGQCNDICNLTGNDAVIYYFLQSQLPIFLNTNLSNLASFENFISNIPNAEKL